MEKSTDYLAKALEVIEGRTDSQKAASLKIAHNTLSQYKSGERIMDNYACTKIAMILGIDPMDVISAAQVEREKTEEKQLFWREFRKTRGQQSGNADIANLCLIVMIMTLLIALLGNATLNIVLQESRHYAHIYFWHQTQAAKGFAGVLLRR